MTEFERVVLKAAVERIPCELTIATYDGKTGSAWLGCKECTRCLLLQALDRREPLGFIQEWIVAEKPLNGGYLLREDLRKVNS